MSSFEVKVIVIVSPTFASPEYELLEEIETEIRLGLVPSMFNSPIN